MEDFIGLIYIYSGGLARIVDVIQRNLLDLSPDLIAKHCQNKESFTHYLESFKENINLGVLNPFKDEKLILLVFLAQENLTFPRNLEINTLETLWLNQFCQKTFFIEDAFLELGIPYSETPDKMMLTINMPKYFADEVKSQYHILEKNAYKYLLFLFNKSKMSESPNRIFEFLIALYFNKMLKTSCSKKKIHFIKEEINYESFANQFKFNLIDRILSNKGEILSNLEQYFNNLSNNSVNIPADESFGPDCCINLIKKTPINQKVFVGVQFSGKKLLSLKKVQEEIGKMVNIIKKMGLKTREQYSKFYYVIVCPAYDKEMMESYFSQSYKKSQSRFEITSNDYVIFPQDSKYSLEVILLHPSYVLHLTDQNFKNAQDENECKLESNLQLVSEKLI